MTNQQSTPQEDRAFLLRVSQSVRRVRPGRDGANTRSRTVRDDAWVLALLLFGHLRHSFGYARTERHSRLAQLWLRSTAVDRRGLSLPH